MYLMELISGAVWLVIFIVLMVLVWRRIDYWLITYPLRRVFYAQILDPHFFGVTV
ncbi:TPA: hypothetical protein ACH2JA_002345 [Enterobacter hormaechei]